jgi:hypothetical protein
MKYDSEELAIKFCSQAFNNMPFLLKSRSIGCFLCGYIFIYDGTEETEPMTIDGNCGMCPKCCNFSLYGDAAGNFISAELQECGRYLKHLCENSGDICSPTVQFFLDCSCNTGKIRQCSSARCLSCGAEFTPEPEMFYDVFDEPVPDDKTFLCHECLAPLVVPGEKYDFFRQYSDFFKKGLKNIF